MTFKTFCVSAPDAGQLQAAIDGFFEANPDITLLGAQQSQSSHADGIVITFTAIYKPAPKKNEVGGFGFNAMRE